MTDPTPEQIEAGARGIYALDPWLAGGDRRFSAYPNLRWEELGKDDQEIYTTQARAALVAAADAAPQEHEHSWEPESTPPRMICACGETPAPSPDREELITEARSLIESWDRKGSWTPDSPVGMIARLVEALAAAGAAPQEPSEGWSTENRREAEAEGKRRWHVEEPRTRVKQRDFDNFNQGCINGFMLGAEWWKQVAPPTPAQVNEAKLAEVIGTIHFSAYEDQQRFVSQAVAGVVAEWLRGGGQ